jgi:predicted small secreted protein
MMQERTALTGVVALLCLTLAGCTVPVTGGTGIFVAGGHVHGIVKMCPDVTASEFQLREVAGSNWERTTWHFPSSGSATADLGTTEEFLARVDDRSMEIKSNASDGAGGWVRFDAADIRALDDGEILSYSGFADDSTIFDTAGFEAEAVLYCPGR